MRRAPAFWNILPRYDRKVGVVAGCHLAAEETNGFIVSSYCRTSTTGRRAGP